MVRSQRRKELGKVHSTRSFMMRKFSFNGDGACVAIVLAVSLFTAAFFGQSFPVSDDGLRAVTMAGQFMKNAGEGRIDMYKPYIGVNLFLVPSVSLAGPTREVFKASQTLFTVLAVLVTFFVAKTLFDRKTALLSSITLAFMPLFVMIRWDEQQFLIFGFMAAMFLCLDFYRKRRTQSLYLASFIFGVSMYVKLTTLYFMAATLFSYALLIRWKKVSKPRLVPRAAALAAVFFLVGMSPLILYNVQNDWKTASLLVGGAFHESGSFMGGLPLRFGQLFLAAEGFEDSYPLSHIFMPAVGLGAGILLLAFIVGLLGRKPSDVFLIVSILGFTFLSALVPPPSPLRIIHLCYVLPFASIIMARFFLSLMKRRLLLGLVLFAILISLNFTNMWTASARLSDESWIEENFQRASQVHYGFGQFLRDGDTLMVPWMKMTLLNLDYMHVNGLNFERGSVCGAVKENDRSVATCNTTMIEEYMYANLSGRLLFVGVPLERTSYSIYEEDCADEGGICYKPLLVVMEAAKAAGREMQKIGVVNDSKGDEAYSVYLIK